MRPNTYQQEEKGYRPLYPLTLTQAQKDTINYYCLEQSYELVEDDLNGNKHKYPFIYNGRVRLPIQLVDGKIVAVNGGQLIDMYQKATEVRMVNNYLSRNGSVKRQWKLGSNKLSEMLIKGCSITKLELQ